MYYFKFITPKMPDGSFAIYPPAWFGEMINPPSPKLTKTLLYNDLEGWGIAQTSDSQILNATGDFEIISEEEALKILDEQTKAFPDITTTGIHQVEKDTRKVWYGDSLRLRHVKTIEENAEEVTNAIDGQLEDIFQQLGWGDPTPAVKPVIAEQKHIRVWCDKCGYSSVYDFNLPTGIMAKSVSVKIKCAAGHEQTINLNPQTGEVL